MRHRKKLNHLSRKSAHRKAMLANIASSLILHKRIRTTTAKAKALRVFVEPLITRSKNDSTHNRRVAFKHLQDKLAVSELFREVSPKVMEREGGYTRIIKLGNRLGDNADMAIIELVDYNELLLAGKTEETKTKARRTRRAGRKKTTTAAESSEEKAAVGSGSQEQTQSSDSEAEEPSSAKASEDQPSSAEATEDAAEGGTTAKRKDSEAEPQPEAKDSEAEPQPEASDQSSETKESDDKEKNDEE